MEIYICFIFFEIKEWERKRKNYNNTTQLFVAVVRFLMDDWEFCPRVTWLPVSPKPFTLALFSHRFLNLSFHVPTSAKTLRKHTSLMRDEMQVIIIYCRPFFSPLHMLMGETFFYYLIFIHEWDVCICATALWGNFTGEKTKENYFNVRLHAIKLRWLIHLQI